MAGSLSVLAAVALLSQHHTTIWSPTSNYSKAVLLAPFRSQGTPPGTAMPQGHVHHRSAPLVHSVLSLAINRGFMLQGVSTPASYPTSRLPILDNPALFEKLDSEALFFAFYHQPGSFQQYLAARELKRQSWRCVFLLLMPCPTQKSQDEIIFVHLMRPGTGA